MKTINLIKQHRYELIALMTGAVVMMLEIVGARLIAPYFGASSYVWTAMIGVILGAMSIGFWYGGRLADQDNPGKDLGLIISAAAVMVLLMVFFQQPVLELIAEQRLDLRLSAVLAAIVLFGVPSFLIGMVSPHLAKIRVTSLKTTGASIGRLEAAGSLGSIGGTFLSGYVLLAYFGARNLSIFLAILLVLTSFLAGYRSFLKARLGLIVVAVLLLFINPLPAGIVDDVDSAYSRYQVRERSYGNRQVRDLVMDSYSIQSSAYTDDFTEPVPQYLQHFLKVTELFGDPERVLSIGGGAHSLPTVWQARWPGIKIDVVEIDPALRDISEKYFGFKKADNTQLFYEDGRSFINKDHKKYKIIYVDAYSSLTPPFHLSSQEAVRRLSANVADDGLIIVNAASDYDEGYLAALYKTYGTVFNNLAAYKATSGELHSRKHNFTLVATSNNEVFDRVTLGLGEQVEIPPSEFVLTDDYAPVERLSY